jgi:hypothetical protein
MGEIMIPRSCNLNVSVVCLLTLTCCLGALPPAAAGLEQQCGDLVGKIGDICGLPDKPDKPKLRVAVYDFPSRVMGHEGLSSMAAEIESRVAEAVALDGRFELISRTHLERMVTEENLQSTALIDGMALVKIKLKPTDGFIVGGFTYRDGKLIISAKLIVYDGMPVYPATVEVPMDIDSVYVLPQSDTGKRRRNTGKIEELAAELPNRDIKVELWIDSETGRTHFAEGELIRYNVRADRECHVALLAHDSDGNSKVLFPNKHVEDPERKTHLTADRIKRVPDDEKEEFRIRITEPFGADIVQVIASSDYASLKALIGRVERYRGFDVRGMVVEAIGAWGETRIEVHTYPKWTRNP